ncbi:nucleotide-binding protein [Micromonospora craniellae]|uniref:Nucleotide-binding protein n=1 Tax=Micromonospora craniellae TaxID=2294034 RepID=A0A372G562_9ACTN|nr:nucleotide-binding protein [Micromonospora craniellae]QOC90421.1 nucleotide-binding protein [Micromonospora craniellae]RFS48187.1 nucleotide-binding protein [Micromonospora craniellae]
MTVPKDALVFDTGPLRHFAAQGWLGVIRFLSGERPVYIPDSVERELNESTQHLSAVRSVLDADWIHVHRSTSTDLIEAFARYENLLVDGRKNVGECGVLAMGQVYKCEVVIDDAVPRRIATEYGIQVTATVPLLCDAIRRKKLTVTMVEELADNLLEGKYYLPFGPGGFRQHVMEHGLLDYDDLNPTR